MTVCLRHAPFELEDPLVNEVQEPAFFAEAGSHRDSQCRTAAPRQAFYEEGCLSCIPEAVEFLESYKGMGTRR